MQGLDKISLNFILSTGRTGSTLLSSMLNMHSEILSVSEEPFAYNLYPKYKNIIHWTDETIEQFCYDFYLFSEGKLEPQFGKKEDLFRLLKEHESVLTGENAIKLAYFAFFPNKDKSRVNTIVDKQLKFHHFLDDVIRFYPDSKFIILYRDPRDNVLVKIRRAQKQKKRVSLLFFAKTWEYEYRIINKRIKLLPANRYLKIKYEDLVEKPEETLATITSFLNLPYDETMLSYDEKFKEEVKRNESTIGETVKQHLSLLHEGLSQKVNTEKVGIWKTQMEPNDYNTVWSICKDTCADSGYKQDSCKAISYFKLSMIYDLFRFRFLKVIIPALYYALPFRLKYLIKKTRYGKNFNNGKWATKDFYKTTLPS